MSLQHAVSQKDPEAVKLCLLYGAAEAPRDSQLDNRVYVTDKKEAESEPRLTPLYNAVAQYDKDEENSSILEIVEALEATDKRKKGQGQEEERPFASLSTENLGEFLGDYYRMKSKEKMLAERLRETIQRTFEPVHREVLEMVEVFKSQMKKCLLCGQLWATCAAKPCNHVFCCELCMKVLTRGGLTGLHCPVCDDNEPEIQNMVAVTWDDASVTREFFEHGVVNGPGGA